MRLTYLLAFMAWLPGLAAAYPSTIGYGYNSCLTCHYNGFGSGSINDYGRAWWANTLAAKPPLSTATDDDLANRSTFDFGTNVLPRWWRPGLKYRGLYLVTSPGSSKQKDRWIDMQADVSTALLFDRRETVILVVSGGYVPQPRAHRFTDEHNENFITREHYLRVRLGRSFYVYTGMMDKVYGIRTADHTAMSRAPLGLGQNDQTHGVALQYSLPDLEVGLHAYLGNLFQKSELRQKGGSGLVEYQAIKNWTVGLSALMSENDFVSWLRYAVHMRIGMGEGSSVLFETGSVRDKAKTVDGVEQLSNYLLIEPLLKLTRGVSLYVQGEFYQNDIASEFYSQPLEFKKDLQIKTAVGLQYYPMQRIELKVDGQNAVSYSAASASENQWALRGQVHLSF